MPARLGPAPLRVRASVLWQAPQPAAKAAATSGSAAGGGAARAVRRSAKSAGSWATMVKVMRVLEPAELGARSGIGAGLVRLEPQHRAVARNGVQLSGEAGHPEAVDHVAGGEMDIHGPPCGMCSVPAV